MVLNPLCNLTKVHSAKYTQFLFDHKVPTKEPIWETRRGRNSEKFRVVTKISEMGISETGS